VGFAENYYPLAYEAFSELMSVELVPASQWVLVGNSLIDSLKDTERSKTEQFSRSLKILLLIMHKLPEKERTELDIADLVGASEFYEGFGTAFSDNEEDEGVAHAIYLAHYVHKGNELPITTDQENGMATEASETGFKWFKEQYEGKLTLSASQIELIAQHAFEAKQVTRWVGTGSALREHKLINRVISMAFTQDTLPYVTLSTVLENFDYLRAVLEDSCFDTLQRFQERFDNQAIEKTSLAQVPVGALSETHQIPGKSWQAFHQSVGDKLLSVDPELWKDLLVNGAHEVALLEEKAKTSGIEVTQMAFRQAFQRFVLGVLDGTVHSFERDIDFDVVFSAIPESFHADLYRQSRESIMATTADGLATAANLFPNYLDCMIRNGDKVMAAEKENMVRHVLSTALEANNKAVLSIFLDFGRQKVANFIKASDDATKDRLKGSMENFTKLSSDRSYTREISDLVNGKRQTKNMWSIWFTPTSETNESDEGD
jgi:hypothetical protein